MSDKEFLPQYAAQAVIELEATAGQITLAEPTLANSMRRVAGLIRSAVHVVLPANGEVYRSNHVDREAPSLDEIESFNGLPAPVTCFEYPFTNALDEVAAGSSKAPKRITLVLDLKQIFTGKEWPEGRPPTVQIVSVFYSEVARNWTLHPMLFQIAVPLEIDRNAEPWGVVGGATNLRDDSYYDIHDKRTQVLFGEMTPDLIAAVQCCHALRAGARFEERTEDSPSRRWKFQKRGVGGFTYHVLKLPAHVIHRRIDMSGGTHASPRLHVRRAHIRKLPTGTLTFVRQCFVGDRERGIVQKHYQVTR